MLHRTAGIPSRKNQDGYKGRAYAHDRSPCTHPTHYPTRKLWKAHINREACFFLFKGGKLEDKMTLLNLQQKPNFQEKSKK